MLLGAHVSTAGGCRNAPDRGAEIGATAIQIFTKQPNRWAEKPITPEDRGGFMDAVRGRGIAFACAHDSYLINLASPDPVLRDRSLASFEEELRRAADLALNAVVTHPGNAVDGDAARGLAQNAELIGRAMETVGAPVRVLLETTAGAGTALGASFEELARIIAAIPEPYRSRVGVCLDTCHAYSAGYDLVGDYDGVLRHFDATIGLGRLELLHLNDSKNPFGSRKDRHAEIGEGSLGEEPFRRIMTDERLAGVPKVLETPKGDDPVTADLRNLGRLRSYLG